jgi:glycerophosphoryl diester phosphodiesterase
MTGTKIIARCGDNKYFPESTLSAFKGAIDKGADGIEFDVHLTRDNKLLIHHDIYLGRTENATGAISDYSLEELRAFDVGDRFDSRFAGSKMPTPDEIFNFKNEKVRFEIDLRTPTLPFLRMVIEAIERWGLEDRVELTSIHLPLLFHVRAINPRICTGIFFDPFPEWMKSKQRQSKIINWLHLTNARVAHMPLRDIDENLVAIFHSEGLIIHGANLNTEADITRAFELELDQFSTDNLDLALEIRNNF